MAAAAGGERGKAELVRARLAAEEQEALEAIKGDLCRWLARRDVLSLEVVPATFLDVLDSGVQICNLAGLVQEGSRRWEDEGKEPPVHVPSQKLACKPIKAARGTPMFLATARDNAAQFIRWCRELGVEEAVIFESVGLVEHSDERRVVLCLLDVARFAEKVGVSPPEIVALEREIEELEAQTLEGDRAGGEERETLTNEEIEEETEEKEEGKEDKVEKEEQEEEEVKEMGCSSEGNEEESGVQREEKGVDRETIEESKEPPAKRVKRVSVTGNTGAATTPPARRRKISPRDKLGKKDTVDKKVMQCVNECTCERTIEVHHCGNGKFTVSVSSPKSSLTTIYARVNPPITAMMK
jgi:hypothetical protein